MGRKAQVSLMNKPNNPLDRPDKPLGWPVSVGVYLMAIEHDDGCPTIESQDDRDCTCDVVGLRVAEVKPRVEGGSGLGGSDCKT
jgi:hypothetical protein